ncbi:glutamate racemase [Thiomicrorhabdus xiamenensis]|uniref:Glutamate racemase n=1 Tax=Thiomicrorhabdus xiamenensis TaxID=2739063 RepID=A0A7D4SY82_9GAMM|nr:glutamate racemase [Thiomicrorhabdus xiamenensis]QKI88844.1 glutamate racemase [Thiomicrorhabdus xiamenensis]
MADKRAIGIFDSGIGGLPIAQKVRELLPNENLLYVADTQFAPYGEKSEDEVLARAQAVVEFMLSQNVKAIVVACNTATMIAIKTLRAKYDLPFIGVEPGVKPAAIHTQSGVIGVLATEKTLSSKAFDALAKRVAGHVEVVIQPSPKLVRLVEELKLNPDEACAAVESYVQPLIEKGADTIILGCTHFAHLAPVIELVAGPNISVISTETAVAKEVLRRLENENLLSTQSMDGESAFCSSGDLALFQRQLTRLWGKDALAQKF